MAAAGLLKPKNILFVILVGVAIAGALPWMGVVNAHSCTYDVSDASAPTLQVSGAFGLSVKAGDLSLTKDLRAALEQRLAARGLGNLVDNPVQRPRADVALEKGELRWTPFYASVHTTTGVLVTEAKGAQKRERERVTIDGLCVGLISAEPWRADLVAHLADQAADAITGKNQ